MSSYYSAHWLAITALVGGIAIGAASERLRAGSVAIEMSSETDGVRCNIRLTRLGDEWLLQSVKVAPAMAYCEELAP